MYDLNETM